MTRPFGPALESSAPAEAFWFGRYGSRNQSTSLHSMAPLELFWNPFDQSDPGPCIKVIVTNSSETIDAGREIGLEYPEPHAITALVDTGSPFTIISRTFAKNWKLFQTNVAVPIRTLAGDCFCEEYRGAISFPDSCLPTIQAMKIRATDFNREPFYSCIIGRDIIRYWNIQFDGRRKNVRISSE